MLIIFSAAARRDSCSHTDFLNIFAMSFGYHRCQTRQWLDLFFTISPEMARTPLFSYRQHTSSLRAWQRNCINDQSHLLFHLKKRKAQKGRSKTKHPKRYIKWKLWSDLFFGLLSQKIKIKYKKKSRRETKSYGAGVASRKSEVKENGRLMDNANLFAILYNKKPKLT